MRGSTAQTRPRRVELEGLVRQLKHLSGAGSLGESLSNLGVLESSTEDFEIRCASEWCRSGAETWALMFTVRRTSRVAGNLPLIVKACAPVLASRPIIEICDEWFERRAILAREGVEVPRVFGRENAMWLEEFVPYSLADRLSESADIHLVDAFCNTLLNVVHSRFGPLSVHDWRSRGGDVVLVDFGSDLGGQREVVDVGGVLDVVVREFRHIEQVVSKIEDLRQNLQS